MKRELVRVVIPDVHERIAKLKRILAEYLGIPKTYLGDFLDSFDGLTDATYETVEWLEQTLLGTEDDFNWGNHELHYAFPVTALICSGWDHAKQQIIKNYLTDEHWKAFKLHSWITAGKTEFLCSHAGLHSKFLHPVRGFDKEYITELCDAAMYRLRYAQTVDPILQIGQRASYSRATKKIGGIVWADWRYEFEPIEGLNQIVGHTQGNIVRCKVAENSVNFNIDTALNHVIEVYNDGTLEFIEVN